MAIAGSWLGQAGVNYPNARIQGSGIAAIHGTRQNGYGRNSAAGGRQDPINQILEDEFAPESGYGYADEDVSSTLYGYGSETGTSERAEWQQETDRSAVQEYWPSYGQSIIPRGSVIRSLNKGANIIAVTKEEQPPGLDGLEGFKLHDEVEDAVTSDPAQYEMQTSMTQRDKTRSGSQAAQGRANDDRASLRSRIVGQKFRSWGVSSRSRHADMEPKSQDLIIRPFHYRTAGTGPVENMKTNEMYVSDPITRDPVSDPFTGNGVGALVAGADGYTSEDVLPYV